ncbi:BlaI/MecI/CopY family transcriptional regulator [Tautonia plasticadhaerens]|uniref:Penicillinase repressor n=1 Tax=Tautonia plasticadhaerens TaxID=2527974 RepID=A0A518HDD3_9BACT|nr:BlaI/MecI/CopY family transcriptional regulator [Tautonia plasticadhaerens]QDV38850.1 Penicillinase repressor [Tautonia plasticadhaerens]
MSEAQFGRMQHRIMRVIWERGRVSARDITEALNRDEPVAHSTVQTLLRQLEGKGAIGHEARGRTFVFFPLVEEDRVRRGATRDLLDRVFGGRAGDLVAHLLRTERLSEAELDELRRLIDRRRKG